MIDFEIFEEKKIQIYNYIIENTNTKLYLINNTFHDEK